MMYVLSEPARLREVHRYYQRPPEGPLPNTAVPTRSNVASTPVAIPDTALTAFLQLITWRLSMQRAIVSLVDKDHQFFIAESTKTGNLLDPSSYEEAGDQQWMGCTGSTTRNEALCTNTIVAEEVPGGYPSFVVTDLPNDPRFADLPYVKGPPYFRYYAGTPLISKAGFRIGSLFVIDDRVHEPLTDPELDFLGVMATNVMRYLELETESREQRRHMTMSKGLAALVEGRARIPSQWSNSEPQTTGTSPSHARHLDAQAPDVSERTTVPEAEIDLIADLPEEGSMLYKGIFARASNLLRESLDVDYSIFLDNSRDHGSGTEDERSDVNVVGYSNGVTSTASDRDLKVSCSMQAGFLKSLCRQYHDGKIWSYYDDGSFDSYDDTPMSLSDDDGPKVSAKRENSSISTQESKILLQCFPHARQILFAPLWGSATGVSSPEYFSACFAISNREVPVFTTEIEVAFVRAFVNSVGVICGHLASALGEKQKSQFISSMSHELRSPLHGILASTELLYATPLSVTQTDLCDTVEVCGQTLLDTLSQILDFSKVNNFLRDTHTTVAKERERSKSSASIGSKSRSGIHAGSSLHVFSECNVATLCEEALDVISMSFRQASAIRSPGVTPLTEFGSLAASQASADNAVVVDFVAPNEDWIFLCSPGAIRRIVMNLVGNSFKYTERGSISVRLGLQSSGEDASKRHTITICVIDTGRGMSEVFMRTKLFVPFSQENTVAPGSGLGLSLVQGIVKSLDGKIDVWSHVGQGTKMKVSFPLKRTSENSVQANGQLKPSSTSCLDGKTYKFWYPRTAIHQHLQESIRYYLKSWWNMEEIINTHGTTHNITHNSTHDITQLADFIFLDSEDVPGILQQQPQQLAVYAIVLSQIPPTPDVRSLKTPAAEILEPLRVPFGPVKLLKALYACIKRSSGVQGPIPAADNTSSLLKFATAGLNGMQYAPPSAGIRPRLIPENRPYSSNSATVTLAHHDHPLRQASQPVTPLKTGLAVLCVDDNAINLKLLNTFAKKLGFDIVESAENGLQAYEIVETSSRGFDVVFMDLTMPVLDGFESTKRIRQLEAQKKAAGEMTRAAIIVALTGLASDEDQKKAFAAGVDHFVTKPLRFKDLKQMLSEWKLHGSVQTDKKEDAVV